MAPPGRLNRLAAIPRIYSRLAWWGLVAPRSDSGLLRVVQGVVLREGEVLLSLRSDLRGWELPGGNPDPGETARDALLREIREETGLEVEVERRVGDYERTGFRPHVARVYRCRPVGGTIRPSRETPEVRWFPAQAPPSTLFPWYRQPLADALVGAPEPVRRRERWGARAILAGLWIDLRMRLGG